MLLKILLLTIPLVLVTFSMLWVVYTWLWRRKYTKERYAFSALAAIVTLTLAFFAAITSKSMPWEVINALIGHLINKPIELATPSTVDFVLLAIIYWIAIKSILNLFAKWDGNKSEEQYELEQRQEPMSLPTAGTQELLRLLKNGLL